MHLAPELDFTPETFGVPFVDLLKITAALEEGESLRFLKTGLSFLVKRQPGIAHEAALGWDQIHEIVASGASLYEELLHGLETTRLLAMDTEAAS